MKVLITKIAPYKQGLRPAPSQVILFDPQNTNERYDTIMILCGIKSMISLAKFLKIFLKKLENVMNKPHVSGFRQNECLKYHLILWVNKDNLAQIKRIAKNTYKELTSPEPSPEVIGVQRKKRRLPTVPFVNISARQQGY